MNQKSLVSGPEKGAVPTADSAELVPLLGFFSSNHHSPLFSFAIMRSSKPRLLVLLALAALCSGYSNTGPRDVPNDEAGNDLDHLPRDSVASRDATATQQEATADVETVARSETKELSRIQQITEPDEPKADTKVADEDVDHVLDVPSGLFEVVDADSVDTHTRQNYASLDAGATILDAAPDTKSPTNLLVPDKDRYMLTPCSNPRKWVVISLSEDVSEAREAEERQRRCWAMLVALIVLCRFFPCAIYVAATGARRRYRSCQL